MIRRFILVILVISTSGALADETDLERFVELPPALAETATVVAAPVFGHVNATGAGRDRVWFAAADLTFLRKGYIAVASGGYGRGGAESFGARSRNVHEYRRGWLDGYYGRRVLGGRAAGVFLGGRVGLGRSTFNEVHGLDTFYFTFLDRLEIQGDEVVGLAAAGFAGYWAEKFVWSGEAAFGYRYTVARYFHDGPELRSVTRHRAVVGLSGRFTYRIRRMISVSGGVEYYPNVMSGGDAWHFEYRDGVTVSDEKLQREFAFWFGPSLML
ncbi:MAG: hypothetical protein JSW52_12565 [Candidatus Coatesbacteria bacterium]|nr:MAG: hypothetical protein JSW52_12565 [Candidatus Coatesbacteria bacterium]